MDQRQPPLAVKILVVKIIVWLVFSCGAFPMTLAQSPLDLSLPDHKQLPESDGTFVKNFQEHPQSLLLTSSISPILDAIHPDGRYAIGQDCGIYWRLTDPPERGAEAPDWFYVPDVPPLLNGEWLLCPVERDRRAPDCDRICIG
jgi:Uma2 family endonuclease